MIEIGFPCIVVLTRDAIIKLCSDPMSPTCCACNSTSDSMLNEQSNRIFVSPESLISRSSFLKLKKYICINANLFVTYNLTYTY